MFSERFSVSEPQLHQIRQLGISLYSSLHSRQDAERGRADTVHGQQERFQHIRAFACELVWTTAAGAQGSDDGGTVNYSLVAALQQDKTAKFRAVLLALAEHFLVEG